MPELRANTSLGNQNEAINNDRTKYSLDWIIFGSFAWVFMIVLVIYHSYTLRSVNTIQTRENFFARGVQAPLDSNLNSLIVIPVYYS